MTLDDLSVRALHRLDRASSPVLHFVVETCFYNLRIFAQQLGKRRENGHFAKDLEVALAKVTDARKQIDDYFAQEATRGATVADLFPREHKAVLEAMDTIEAHAKAGAPAGGDREACQRFSREVVSGLDIVRESILEMRRAVSARRTSVREIIQELVAIHHPMCEAEGVAVRVDDRTSENPLIFAEKDHLVNALGELLRNTLRHAFKKFDPDTGKQITIRLRTDPRTKDVIIVISDNGLGMAPEQLARLGYAGASTSGGGDGVALVRRVVEEEHLGRARFRSRMNGGTCVRVRLPYRADPDLDAPPETTKEVLQETGGRSPWRVVAAALVLLFMLGAGAVAAWMVLERQAPATLTVAADGTGQFARISDALAAARAGTTILVAGGEYQDHLVIDKAVEIVGTGDRAAGLRATRSCAVISSARGAVLKNLRIALETDIDAAAVLVTSGDLRIEDCEISSEGLSCIEVAGGEPQVSNCLIYQGRRSGIFVHDGASGRYKRNEIRDCKGSAIAVSSGAGPTFLDNVIRRCEKGGIYVYSGGRGVFEKNDVSECLRGAVVAASGADPTVRFNNLHDNEHNGLLFLDAGRGTFTQNHIHGNLGDGIVISPGAAPVIRKCRIESNSGRGLWVKPGAAGVVRDNRFSANGKPDRIELGAETVIEGNIRQ